MKKILAFYFLILMIVMPLFSQNDEGMLTHYYHKTLSHFGLVIHTDLTSEEELSKKEPFVAFVNQQQRSFEQLKECKRMYELEIQNQQINSFFIKTKPEMLNHIRSIFVYNGAKEFVFNNLNEFKFDLIDNETLLLELPSQIWHSTLFGYNHRGLLFQTKMILFKYITAPLGYFNVIFLPIYLGLLYLLIPYVNQFKNIAKKIPFYPTAIAIFLIGLLLRLHNAGYYELWYDEYFSVNIGGNYLNSWMNIFSDPGNPPFYYILTRLFEYIFPINDFYVRLPAILSGVLLIIAVGGLSKDVFKKDIIALFMMLCVALNPGFIALSQFARGYAFSLTSLVCLCWLTYKMAYENKWQIKYFVLFALLGSCFINTHYYNVLYLGGNFFFLLYYLKKQHQKLSYYIRLLMSYSVIGLSFLPFFFLQAFKGAWQNKQFNNWIDPLTFQSVTWELHQLMPQKVLVVFLVIFFILYSRKLLNKYIKRQDNRVLFLMNYAFWMIGFMFVSALGVSTMRSIIVERYLWGIYILLFIFVIGLCHIEWKLYLGKFLCFFSLLWLCALSGNISSFVRTHLVMNAFARMPAFFDEVGDEEYYLCTPDIVWTDNLLTVQYPPKLKLMDRCYLSDAGAGYLLNNKKGRLLLTDAGFPEKSDFFAEQETCVIDNKETRRRYLSVKNLTSDK